MLAYCEGVGGGVHWGGWICEGATLPNCGIISLIPHLMSKLMSANQEQRWNCELDSARLPNIQILPIYFLCGG